MDSVKVGSPQKLPPATESPDIKCSKLYGACKSFKQIFWTVPLAYSYLWTAAIITMPQPFYPALASSRGLPAWKFAFVFSAVKVGMLLASFSMKLLMKHLPPTNIYLLGQGGALVYCAAVGALYWAGSDIFLGLSLLTMTFGGFSVGIQSFTMYTAATPFFPENSGALIATMECMFGVGVMIGSVISGVLIDLWAFPLPFFVVGVAQSLFFPFFAVNGVTPKIQMNDASLVADLQQPAAADMPFGRLLRDSIFMLNTFSVMLSWVIMGFNEPTLGPYLEQFGLSNTEVGVCFMVQYASYAVGSLISGMFCQFQMEIFFNFASLLLTALSFMIIGPVPFLPCQPSLWMVYVSLVLMGNGMAALFVCSYCQALRRATELGYPDNLRTSGFVSSVLFPSLVIGGLATSPIAGYLVDTFGYRKGSMFMFVTLLTWTPVTLFQWQRSNYLSRKNIAITTREA
ncbi:uncharacterized protein ISCGN_012607 [Ixodes scapularis]